MAAIFLGFFGGVLIVFGLRAVFFAVRDRDGDFLQIFGGVAAIVVGAWILAGLF